MLSSITKRGGCLVLLLLFNYCALNIQAQENRGVAPVAGIGLKSNLNPASAALGGAIVLSNYNTYSDLANPASIAFSPNEFGVGVTYNPWILGVSGGDMMNITLGSYYKVGASHGVFFKGSFFSIGDVNLLSGDPNQGGVSALASLFEWNVNLGYTYALTNDLSVGLGLKYFQSQQVGDVTNTQVSYATANVFSGDLYVRYDPIIDSGKIIKFDAGLILANFGTKANYTGINTPYWAPTYAALGLGVSALVKANTIRLIVDIKKDLVPYAPNVSATASELQAYYDQSVFDSWGQALGEFTLGVNVGLEYIYSDFAFVRLGYMNDNFSYYSRDAYTFGLGYIFDFGLSADISYWLPGNAYESSARFTNTFSVGFSYEF